MAEEIKQPATKEVAPISTKPVQPAVESVTQPVQAVKEAATTSTTTVKQPEVKAEDKPVVVERPVVRPVVVKDVAKATVTSDEDVIDAAILSDNKYIVSIENALSDYVRDMSPGVARTPKDGGNIQMSFYNTLNQLYNRPSYEEFKQAFMVLLAYVNKYKDGCFSDRYLFRFAEEWPGSSEKLTSFQAGLNLLKVIANTKERPVSKYVSLERVYNTGFSDKAKENITRFIS